MKTRKKIVCLTPLSPEDKALVEALVDGELDDSVRRELLVRLDRIDGGWKFCAVSFLEAQCFRESFASFSGDWTPFFADSSSDWGADINATSSLPDVDVSDRTPISPDSSRGEKNSADISSERSFDARSFEATFKKGLFSGNAALRADGFCERANFNDVDFLSAENETNVPPSSNAGRRELPEPRIIPIKQGGYRNVYRTSRGGSDGGGPTWRAYLASMAGGFLLAVALVGVLYAQLSPTTSGGSIGGDSTQLANIGTSVGSVETATPLVANVDQKSRFAQNATNAEIDQETETAQTPNAFDADGAVRVVTLKSPRHQLDGVSVPCFAADRFDAAAFRNANADVPPQIAEQLRRTGGRVATSRDEYRFPLEDGRILILPVDTYDVQYENNNRIQ